jgi:enoyl-CoA hydratase/carnithine racemase
MDMFETIAETASSLAKDTSVRAVILSGEGKSFCSGLDVKGIMKEPRNMVKLLERPAGSPISNLAQDVG